ncbi:hypothetical protein ACFQ71_37535 [Streptomyces sp. NPDC056534]|uniref:hypothetical protein n=1 Tax=Streptomyces sp. NPDC056534 TaxID=3345857 RepID=UPI0036C423E6
MSVYTPQQIGQPQMQQPYGQQSGQSGQQPWMSQGQGLGQQGKGQFGQQQPWVQQGQGQFGQQGQQQLPVLVTEVSLKCAASALSAVVEQLRMDPQILMGIQSQGQIPPHVFGQVLTECARRIAPVVHMALGQITGQGQGGQMGQFGQFGQGHFGQQPWEQQMRGQSGQSGQFPGMGQGSFGQGSQGQFGMQPGM